MQLTQDDLDILNEASTRVLDAVNNLKRVTAETFIKAQDKSARVAARRGNSDRTLIDLEVMLRLLEVMPAQQLFELAHTIGGMEWLRGLEGQYASDSRAGNEDTSDARAYVIADRWIEVHKRPE